MHQFQISFQLIQLSDDTINETTTRNEINNLHVTNNRNSNDDEKVSKQKTPLILEVIGDNLHKSKDNEDINSSEKNNSISSTTHDQKLKNIMTSPSPSSLQLSSSSQSYHDHRLYYYHHRIS